jgi:cysteinyl-tRNA synthetase
MMKVYNTLTNSKQEFKPLKEGEVGIYVCGVTPYNYPHIGNARPFVTWDVIKRFFNKCGYKVKHIQNFTDIDDKIIRTANEQGVKWSDISEKYISAYFQAMDALHVRRADVYPKVSEHIPDIIAMIQTLVDKGYAYPMEGDVYFSVEKFDGYGKLSGRKLEDMQAGARIDVDTRKHHPMDFALWKAAKPGEPSWESPWGKGRPGWHIECSTMSLKYLGKTFDFHGGGSDLIFPHHENEIAQSQACCSDPHSFARYWLHNGFITINQEKMSKSKNNFFTVQDILKKYSGEVLRFFILQTHYRSPLDFAEERLAEAQTSLGRLKNSMDNVKEMIRMESLSDSSATDLLTEAENEKKMFYEAMEDDFNTALAISHMFALSKEINIYYNMITNGKMTYDAGNFTKVKAIYEEMADIIGILEDDVQYQGENEKIIEDLMKIIIELRQQARANKAWDVADKIRDDLTKMGITMEDSPTGVRWKKHEV